jgi:hypothetical protein
MRAAAKPNLASLLAGLPAGAWAVLDPGMSKVLGAARTLEGAIRKAQVKPPTSTRAAGRLPVVVQVPDPSMGCFL